MRPLPKSPNQDESKSSDNQVCVKAIRNANLPPRLQKEVESFIKRNTLPDCGKVPPNCLKAHMIKTAKKLKLSNRKIEFLNKLFRSKIGYERYYLDAGKLKRV